MYFVTIVKKEQQYAISNDENNKFTLYIYIYIYIYICKTTIILSNHIYIYIYIYITSRYIIILSIIIILIHFFKYESYLKNVLKKGLKTHILT